MIYWVTETIHSSARIYYESREQPVRLSPDNRVMLPVAVALFPKEIPMPPRSLAERGFNIARWTSMPKGGHFAAMEQPDLLTRDIQDFFRPPPLGTRRGRRSLETRAGSGRVGGGHPKRDAGREPITAVRSPAAQ
jgi:hypothetical protein